jgi:predicted nucleic-acid-binding protein
MRRSRLGRGRTVIAVDTNVVVRLLTNDNPVQAERAAALFDRETIFLPKAVLLEAEWVLRYSYELAPQIVLDAFRRLLGLPNDTAEDASAVARALAWYEAGMDFADGLHLASARDATPFATFDTRLAKRAGREIAVRVL